VDFAVHLFVYVGSIAISPSETLIHFISKKKIRIAMSDCDLFVIISLYLR